jgi:hypothetical protein
MLVGDRDDEDAIVPDSIDQAERKSGHDPATELPTEDPTGFRVLGCGRTPSLQKQ